MSPEKAKEIYPDPTLTEDRLARFGSDGSDMRIECKEPETPEEKAALEALLKMIRGA